MEVHVSLKAETLFHIGPVPVTNAMLTMFIVMGLLLLVGTLIARSAKVIPSRKQSLFELIAEFLLGLVEGTAGKRAGRRIFPLVGGIFIFILFANYSGLIPGVGTIGTCQTIEESADGGEHKAFKECDEDPTLEFKPFFRAPNSDLNMTLAMALVTFTVVQFSGIAAHGLVGRIKHMADPWWIFPLELVQEFARIISLSFRLFGNIFAGEVLLGVMVAMANAIKIAVVPLFFPVVFLFLEVLFGTIQALVFALLTLIYITLATAGGHGDEEHAQEHEPEPGHGRAAPAGVGD